jgi:hypothetical protein
MFVHVFYRTPSVLYHGRCILRKGNVRTLVNTLFLASICLVDRAALSLAGLGSNATWLMGHLNVVNVSAYNGGWIIPILTQRFRRSESPILETHNSPISVG